MPKKELENVLKNDEVETTEDVPTEEIIESVETTDAEEVAKSEEAEVAPQENESESDKPVESAETDTEANADVEAEETTPTNENESDDADAAAQEDEAPASAEAAPEQAEEAEENVEKSAVLGDWTEQSLVASSISDLAWTLQDYIWAVFYNDETSAGEKLAAINAGVDEFAVLVKKVAAAVVANPDAEAIKSEAEKAQANKPEAVKKSFGDLDAQIRALTKALADTESKLEAAEAEVLSKEGELETATKALEDAETQAALTKGRKAYVVGKFGELIEEEEAKKAASKESVYDIWMKQLGVVTDSERIAA